MDDTPSDITRPVSASSVERALDAERFERWARKLPEVHEGAAVIVNDELYWTPLVKPLAESTMAIVSSFGVHERDDEAFDLLDPEGDLSIRFIPGTIDATTLAASHGHVDTTSANTDINVAFPIDRLRELVDEGRIGRVADTHYGIMGWCPRVERMRDEVAPQIIERLRTEAVDAVLLVPG